MKGKGPKLSVRNLSKSFPANNAQLPVLSDVNLHVDNCEFVSILGPSGCGKSTLLNIVAGLENYSSGSVAVDGQNQLLGSSGYMLQKPLLLPWKTIRQNVMLGLLVQKQPHERANRQADALLKKFGLIDFADQYPAVLSGGMAQRAAVARTILTNQELLLMDEPFGSLDAVTRMSMQMWLLEVWNELNCSMLFITHDIREAILLSNRIYVLSSRPASVLKEVVVDLPMPRKREFLRRKSSINLEAELERVLLGQ